LIERPTTTGPGLDGTPQSLLSAASAQVYGDDEQDARPRMMIPSGSGSVLPSLRDTLT
jgi:hypothetical protein